ncbi:hypothetical protein HYH02_015314 [Chlamydomonas schloesseri]|uniref:Protein kinase domain-containing protein n=1 Tax=Chlamydomonas schloesseri TaxID=2026947 RepID=A0A835SHF1_9CHLO|nr:hypothetical protein HYH02_015314 [Chlamydomonas schloesseri]|eukprot:KAG2423483.1 hypothetical protein HYH02_015314 [Chlamydomonas schloesseri]
MQLQGGPLLGWRRLEAGLGLPPAGEAQGAQVEDSGLAAAACQQPPAQAPGGLSGVLLREFAHGEVGIGKSLGSGAYGDVKRGTVTATSELLAVKFWDEESRACMDSNMAMLLIARSPCLVHPCGVLYDADGRTCGLSFPLVGDGGTLQDLWDSASVAGVQAPLRTLLAAAEGAVRGLKAMHSAGFIHRDLKPANVLVTSGADNRLVAKLLDFYLACRPGVHRGEVGTEAFRPPEAEDGADTFHTERLDYYSVGAIVVALLTDNAKDKVLRSVAVDIRKDNFSSMIALLEQELAAVVGPEVVQLPEWWAERVLPPESKESSSSSEKGSSEE